MNNTTEVERGGQAIAEVQERYHLERSVNGDWFVWSGHPTRRELGYELEHERGTRAECQAWIDAQAALAAYEAHREAK